MTPRPAERGRHPQRLSAPRQLSARIAAPIAFGTILQPLNSSMIAVVLSGVRAHFGGGDATWLVSGLFLAAAVAAPATGRIADLFGPRRTALGGLALVATASAVAPWAPSLGVLIGLRVLIGIGTAAQFPAGVALIRGAAARTGSATGSALALLAVASQTAAALGPALGGLLGWPGTFWINVPLALTAAVALSRSIPPDPAPTTRARTALRSMDLPGMLLFTATATTLMLGLLSLETRPQWLWLAAVPPLAALLVAYSRRRRDAFLDVRLLARPSLSLAYLRSAVAATGFYTLFYGLPQWLEESRHLDAAGAGIIMLPLAALGIASTLLAARLTEHRGPRAALLAAAAALTAGGLLLGTAVDRHTPLLALLAVLALLGLPNGLANMANQASVYAATPPGDTGAASGLYRTSQYAGANLAGAAVALLAAPHTGDAGLHHLGLAVGAAGVVLVLLTPRPARS
ncbi:MFS transporter [Streptomyces monticola]|uniref:MFS transporter n=1 Tax=Streptomyces monticola TaxID=2666263 RepID=A0ABW2JU23_9ACTN